MTIALLILLAGLFLAVPRLIEPAPVGAAVAPNPADHPAAVVQVYGADVWGLRGRFAMHTWIATKAQGAATYTVYQVIGWQLRRYGSVVNVSTGKPDQPWFGSEPVLLLDRRGADAAGLIDRIDDAVRSYPYAQQYTMWPGPNSNSFTAWVGLQVPELALDLPFKAIGKRWME
ncbi:MAG: DUF3750 domain-containing protein, partial [Pseudomonadota bacterium]